MQRLLERGNMETQVGKIPSNVQEVPGSGETLQAARERFNETWDGVNEQARYAAEYAGEAVRSNPWTSVGIGFGVGVVIGALIAIAAGSRSSHHIL
jgi:ElaB/YqjD/DUF883 family membrane-anchored ribosome-binding protein